MSTRAEAIAIVGMACRFPGGANDPESFWGVLEAGLPVDSEITPDRFDVDALFDPEPGQPGKTYVRRFGLVDDLAGFDNGFFRISAAEARYMDP
ncbi:MAG: hypothetical protein KC457_27435, partial [Myxococcales bacterium]|nr:hypothetical protein [Myxococcales bacterium]